MFHMLLLKSTSDNVLVLRQVSDNYLIEQEDWYKVKKILRHKNINKKRYYLIKWKDYFNSENIWKLKDNLNNCLKTIKKHL